MLTAATPQPGRLWYVTTFTAYGGTTCPDCGHPLKHGERITQTRPHTETQTDWSPYTLHTTCWERRTRGVFHPEDILTFTDTREFTTDYDSQLCIVVQTAVCHDPATGDSRLGRATYYLSTEYSSDPLFNLRRADRVYHHIDVPVPSEAEAARHLAEIDPAEFDWDGENTPTSNGPGGDWIAQHWPEDIIDRHNDHLDDQD